MIRTALRLPLTLRPALSQSLALVGLLSLGLVAADAATPLPHDRLTYAIDSGSLANASREEAVAFSEVVRIEGVDWIRLSFDDSTLLQGGSRLRVTSLLDGAIQHLDATNLERWGYTSAYFNGPSVRLELLAAPATWANRVRISEVTVSRPEPVGITQCGDTDDREPSSFPERARVLDIRCSASIVTAGSCFLTAGHCASNLDVVQFNVPPSLSDGTIQHPGPEDQYVIDDLLDSQNAGVGKDWAFFTVSPNSETGLRAWEAQGELDVATSIPPLGTEVAIVGYGIDDGERNNVQQGHVGPLVDPDLPDMIEYQVDTEGSNSGSPVTLAETGELIGVHTHGGCEAAGPEQGNAGTSILAPDLQAGLALCPLGAPFGLAAPVPGLPGEVNDWAFEGALPGATVWVLLGSGVGTTPVPGCDGLHLGLAGARPVGSTVADANGDGTVSRDIQGAVSGSFYFQAVDMADCRLSERVRATFAP